jgi:hypothetical protein
MGTRMIALALAGTLLSGPMLVGAAQAATPKKPVAAKTVAAKPAEPDAPPALTREAAKAHAAEIFDRLDFNHDGVFNAADGKARREARLGEMFDRLDANHDGSVTKAEFITGHEQPHDGPHEGGRDATKGDMPPPPPGDAGPRGPMDHGPRDHGPMGHGRMGMMPFSPMVFGILRAADPDHTGSVTKDAFIAAELKRFDEADANHDGKVTRDEMRASRHEHHGWGRDREGRFGHEGRGHEGPRHGGPHGPRDDDGTPPPPPAPPAAK